MKIGLSVAKSVAISLANADTSYGIEWDITNPITAVTRIGNMTLHALLPIQSLMRGCLLLDGGAVNYYLNPTDWTKKADGTASNLDGSDGQVMVEIPAHYRTFYQNGNKQGCLLSLQYKDGFSYVPKWYISAYEACLDRTNLKLASVVNTSKQYRGGDNNATVDAAANTRLGMPVTNLSRTQFRTYARARGSVNWNELTYDAYNSLFWLYYVEYANLNCQLPFNAQKNANGYAQGGLGNGVTDLDSTLWGNFNAYNPVIPTGTSNAFGNGSGEISYNMPSLYNSTIKTTKVNRYRGVENPFGHIWKWMDGVNIEIQADSAGALSKIWLAKSTADYSDTGYVNHVYVGNMVRLSNYIISMILGTCIPASAGGGSTTYWSDYNYTSLPATGEVLRGLLFGGSANNGSCAGFAAASSNAAPAYAGTNVGSRLCYLGS
jgi:hypothetical protein